MLIGPCGGPIEVNKLFEEPKDEAEVEKLILSIYR
jgi:hypothetical protein